MAEGSSSTAHTQRTIMVQQYFAALVKRFLFNDRGTVLIKFPIRSSRSSFRTRSGTRTKNGPKSAPDPKNGTCLILSLFPSTTPIRFYVRISEFSSHELQNWGEGFTSGPVLAQYQNFHFPGPKMKFPFPAQCPFLDPIFQFSPVLGILFPSFQPLSDSQIKLLFTRFFRMRCALTSKTLNIVY